MSNQIIDPIGVGIVYPLRFDDGKLTLTANSSSDVSGDAGIGPASFNTRNERTASMEEQKAAIRQAVHAIVETKAETKFFNGQFGSLVDRVNFEVNDSVSQSLVASYGNVAVQTQEDRVTVLAASGSADEENPEAIRANLSYQIRSTLVTDSVSIPVESV